MNAVQVESKSAESCVVGIWEGVDDGVERIATDNIIVVFCGAH